ncbi:MAG: maltokinase N-terminal cap-like domain-containing protein [Nocardioides sp.]
MTDDLTLTTLHHYVAHARWFGGKGRPFAVTGTRRLGTLGDGAPTLAVELLTLTYEDAEGGQDLYQVPLAHYPEPRENLEHALLGSWDDADLGTTHVYDAVHDRTAMGLLYAAFDSPPPGDLHFERLPGHDLDLTTHSTLFSGEQSNSSVAFGEDALLKVFRRITPGRNPDISVHEVLTRAGSDHVASLYGWIETGTGDDVLQLAMLQQFLRTASDGWELALASVRNLFAEGDLHADEVGGDFAGEAARLGVALRETHESLAEHFPRRTRDRAEQVQLAAQMGARLDAAARVVPELAAHATRLTEVFDRVTGLTGVTIQQIHGDLHLGQTLRTVKGWKIVDFEGEPAKPLTERVLPDSPWRDVAGMLRSFDYAPRVVERTYGDSEPMGSDQRAFRAKEWSKRNRSVFLEAYAGRPLTDDEDALLAAYVADKAVYEAVYEARNRPSWLTIPLDAIAEVVAA